LGSNDEPCFDFDGQIIDYNCVPYTDRRMKPSPEKANEGRVNPKGIPYLYLSTDEKTAVSEVRPWVGSYVTVAEFETCRDLKVVDCSRCDIDPIDTTVRDLDMLWKLEPPEPEEATKIVCRWIDMAFSKPVDRDESLAGYVSTQIIAELFKTNGFDGIKYNSLFNGGKNIALFDIDSLKQRENSAKVIQITKMDLDFKQVHPFPFKKINADPS
jgi:hypothetical protein